jgi:chitodextrinase
MIKQLVWVLVCFLTTYRSLAAPPGTTEAIRIDQFGYFQNARKVAVIVNPQVGSNADKPFNASAGPNQYQVRRWADDGVVFTGTIQAWNNGATQANSGDKGWWFDFSSVNTPGSYYIFDVGNNVGSYRFEIGDNVYRDVLKAAVRMYYYQRINFAKQPPFTDAKWSDGAILEGPGQDRQATYYKSKGDMSTAKDLHGGWMDAGDMNKYVTFAEEPVALLLEAFRFNPSVFGDDFNIPESGNGVPDILDEVKYELDFMRRMQDATGTGGLFLKVGFDTYLGEVTPPSSDRRPRYYIPECTSATLSGAAMFAVAGAVFKTLPALASDSQDYIARAERAFARAKVTTANFSTFDLSCDNGEVVSGDADKSAAVQLQSAVVAAIYLFEATGKAEYKTFVEAQYQNIEPIKNEWYGPYLMHVHTALLRYAANAQATPSVSARIRSIKSVQNDVVSINDYKSNRDLYRAYMPDDQYHWGSNQVRGNSGVVNMDFVNFNINTSNSALYREVANEYLHWFHGVNAQGKVMLSNMYQFGADNSQNEIYHTWFGHGTDWDNALTSPKGPAPGYLTGGPNNMNQYDGTEGYIRNEPLQKRYKDWNTGYPENSWIFTEVAIYNQAPYVSLLSRLMVPTTDPTDKEPPTTPTNLVASDLSPYSVKLTWNASTDNRGTPTYEVYQGDTKIAETPQTFFDVTTLSPSNSYVFTIKAVDFSANRSNSSNAVTVNTPAPSANDYIIYGDALKSTISDWSWGSTNNPSNTDPVKVGQRSLKVDVAAAYGALSLRNSEVLKTANFPGGVQFWLYTTTGKTIRAIMSQIDTGETSNSYRINAEPNTWTLVRIPWSEWGNPTQIQRLTFADGSGSTQSFILDDVRLIAGDTAPDTQAPSTPTNLAASNVTTTSLRLTWTASTDNVGVTAYQVYQGNTLLNDNVTTTSFDVTGLSCNTAYSFIVKAKDAAGNVSASSNALSVRTTTCTTTDTQAPTVPTNLAANNVTSNGLTLTWTASTDNVGVTAYQVYQGNTLLNDNVTTTSFDVTGLSCNTAYSFTVKAKDAAGNVSASSNALSVRTTTCTTTDTQAPTVPTNLAANNVTSNGLTLTWTASTDNVGVTAYEVYQNGTLLNGNVTGTSLAVSNLSCGTVYTLTVLAKDAAGNKSVQSAPVSVTTSACPPATPSGSDVIYDEALNSNWQEWSWSVNRNYDNVNPVKVGQKSLAVNYTDGWGGWSIIRNSYFTATPQTTIRFWIYATSNKTIGVYTNAENESQQSTAVSFVPTPNTWQEVVITMAQLGNPARIKRLTIQNQASGAAQIYLDNIRIEPSFNLTASNVTTTGLRLNWTASTSNGVTYEVYQNGTLLNGNVATNSLDVTGLTCGTGYTFMVSAKDASGTKTDQSVPLSVTTVACPSPTNGEVIYDEVLNTAWQEWSWGINRNYDNTNPVKVGQKALSVMYNGGWGGWSIIRNAYLNPTAQTTIKFWIYAATNKTIGVYTNAENESQQSATFTFKPTPGVWQEVVITMAQLGNPAKIKRLTIQSQDSGDNQIYLDNIRTEAPVAARVATTLDEVDPNGQMTVSPNPTDGPVRVQVLISEAQKGVLTILDLKGTSILNQPAPAQAGLNEYKLDLSQLTPGMYLVQWQSATKRLVQRLVVAK